MAWLDDIPGRIRRLYSTRREARHPRRPIRIEDGLSPDSSAAPLRDTGPTNGALSSVHEAVQATPEELTGNYFSEAELLHQRSNQLIDRYRATRSASDLEEAIKLAREAVEKFPENPQRATHAVSLGKALRFRYTRSGKITDLEEAIRAVFEAVQLTPESHPDHSIWLHYYSRYLSDRFVRTGATADLDHSIRAARKVIKLLPPDDPDRVTAFQNLSRQLGRRYQRTEVLSDLEEAIEIGRYVIGAMKDGDPRKAAALADLSHLLSDRSMRTEEITDLDEAIRIARGALTATKTDDPDKTAVLSHLGVVLAARYSKKGVISDLDESIQIARETVENTPTAYYRLATRLMNLGGRLGDRYLRTGVISDLEEAIQIAYKAIQATPDDHPEYARRLDGLGVILGQRYLQTGAIADLEEAIRVASISANLAPADHPERATYLHNLSNHLDDLYLRTGSLHDIEKAIEVAYAAVKATPESLPDRAVHFHTLGVLLRHKYTETKSVADLEEAVSSSREAVRAIPNGHPHQAGLLSGLSVHLGVKYSETKANADLEESIQMARNAIEASPEEHPNRANWLTNLGVLLGDRYSKTEAIDDLKESISCYRSALRQANSSPLSNVLAVKRLIPLYTITKDWQAAYNDFDVAMQLIPKITSRSLIYSDKQHQLLQVVGLACHAAAAALNANKGPLVALNFLEQGRGVLAESVEETRADVLELEQKHPSLAKELSFYWDQLKLAATQRENGNFNRGQGSQRYEAGKKLDQLILEIRKRSGFEAFLLPPSAEKLQLAAEQGPIAVINVSEYRCDAILVEQHQVRSLALPRLSNDEIRGKVQQGNFSSPKILEWLWDAVVYPILDALGFTQNPSSETCPHIWWVPTGLLSKFPLHAAGRNKGTFKYGALDRVMSSYAMSITTIIRGRSQNQSLQHIPTVQKQALLAAMQDTEGQKSLPYAATEIEMLRVFLMDAGITPIEPARFKKDIISSLPSCQIFHFAGHGQTDVNNPTQSRLLLKDWKEDPLTVANLIEINIRKYSPFLAYLSACGTGQIHDQRFLDEGIHLINAFQLAGFRHVIGTLWEVDDEMCVDMARKIYEGIKDGGMTDESVCWGLHMASRVLRDRWLSSTNNPEQHGRLAKDGRKLLKKDWAGTRVKDGKGRDAELFNIDSSESVSSENEAPCHWVSFVHFGV